MKRRSFIHSGGILAAAGLSCNESPINNTGFPDLPAIPGDSADERNSYVSAMLDILCKYCGPRPAGSKGYDLAADMVRRDLNRSAETEFNTYTFERWLPERDPELTIGEETIHAYYGIGSSSTPAGGIDGILKTAEGRVPYAIVHPDTGSLLAHLATSPRANAERARSVSTYGLEPHCPPFVIVGTHTEELLKKAVEEELLVSLTASVEFTEDVPTSNVVATIPGNSSEEVLFVAHLDTVYPSPGANDNAASVILVMLLAHALSGKTPKHTLRFIATADEETGSHGMGAYLKRRRENDTFDRITASVNFDSVTWGPNLDLRSNNSDTRRIFAEIDRDLRLPGVPKIIETQLYSMDNRWFRDYPAVDAITVGSIGYDNSDYCWHRPNDIPENVPMECMEPSFLMFREYIARTEGV